MTQKKPFEDFARSLAAIRGTHADGTLKGFSLSKPKVEKNSIFVLDPSLVDSIASAVRSWVDSPNMETCKAAGDLIQKKTPDGRVLKSDMDALYAWRDFFQFPPSPRASATHLAGTIPSPKPKALDCFDKAEEYKKHAAAQPNRLALYRELVEERELIMKLSAERTDQAQWQLHRGHKMTTPALDLGAVRVSEKRFFDSIRKEKGRFLKADGKIAKNKAHAEESWAAHAAAIAELNDPRKLVEMREKIISLDREESLDGRRPRYVMFEIQFVIPTEDRFGLWTPDGWTYLGIGGLSSAAAAEHEWIMWIRKNKTAQLLGKTVPAWTVQWALGDDTGISSKALLSKMLGLPSLSYGWPPADGGDVGRCVRLLDLAESNGEDWRSRIGEMAKGNEGWAKLAPHWAAIEEAHRWDLENPSRTQSKCYDLLRDLRDERPTPATARGVLAQIAVKYDAISPQKAFSLLHEEIVSAIARKNGEDLTPIMYDVHALKTYLEDHLPHMI